jgi:hypothetical protein
VKLTPEDMQGLVRTAQGMTLKQAKKAIAYAALEDGHLTGQDIDRVLKRKTQIIREPDSWSTFPWKRIRLSWGALTV